MTNRPDRDRIAHEAARLMEADSAESIGEAIRQAAEALGLTDADLPGPGRVRQHLRGMAMQTMGLEEYTALVREVLQGTEELMTLLETAFDDVRTQLAGRAARGFIDGGVRMQLRVITRRSITELAELLVDRGYDEPEFETADTRLGRLDRIILHDERADLVLTRCLPSMAGALGVDLFSGASIDVVDLDELRRRIERLEIR